MKPVLDIYLRRVIYNIRTIQYDIELPFGAAHFHNIPRSTSKLYVYRHRVYYISQSYKLEVGLNVD